MGITETQYPNPNCRTFHGRKRLGVYDKSEPQTERGKVICATLDMTNGICQASVSLSDCYAVTVLKGDAFSWDELRPHILNVLDPNLTDNTGFELP